MEGFQRSRKHGLRAILEGLPAFSNVAAHSNASLLQMRNACSAMHPAIKILRREGVKGFQKRKVDF